MWSWLIPVLMLGGAAGSSGYLPTPIVLDTSDVTREPETTTAVETSRAVSSTTTASESPRASYSVSVFVDKFYFDQVVCTLVTGTSGWLYWNLTAAVTLNDTTPWSEERYQRGNGSVQFNDHYQFDSLVVQADMPRGFQLEISMQLRLECGPNSITKDTNDPIRVLSAGIVTVSGEQTLLLDPTSTIFSLQYHYTVVCSDGYERPDCTECFDQPGRYRCNNVTQGRDCVGNFHSHDCDVYCRPVVGRYSCDNVTGARQCLSEAGWYGPDCDIHCVVNSSSAHYTCDPASGARVCTRGWYGQNCTDSEQNSSAQDFKVAFIVSIALAGVFLIILIGVVAKYLVDRRKVHSRPDIGLVPLNKVPELSNPIPRQTAERYSQDPLSKGPSTPAPVPSSPQRQTYYDDGEFDEPDDMYDQIGEAKHLPPNTRTTGTLPSIPAMTSRASAATSSSSTLPNWSAANSSLYPKRPT